MKRWLVMLGMIGVIFGCSTYENTYPTNSSAVNDKEADFSKYKTFAWLPRDSSKIQNVLFDNEIVGKTIRELVTDELYNRGFRLDNNSPDALIQYTLMVEKNESRITTTRVIPDLPTGPNTYIPPYNANAYDSPVNLYYYSNPGNIFNTGYYINNYPYYSTYGFPSVNYSYQLSNITQEFDINEGTLIIDLIDRKTGELIWRGWYKQSLEDLKTFERNLPDDVSNIFKKYPLNRPNY